MSNNASNCAVVNESASNGKNLLWVTILLVLILGVNVFACWYIVLKGVEIDQRTKDVKLVVESLKGIPVNLPLEFRAKFERDLETIAESAREGMKVKIEDVIPRVDSELSNVTVDIKRMCQSKVLGNEVEAEQSYVKAVECLAVDDIDMAKVYCMNAINHSPTKKLYFEKLVEIVDRNPNSLKEEWEQVKSALEIGMFQVVSSDIDGVRSLLAKTLERIEAIEARELAAQKENNKEALALLLVELRDGTLSLEEVFARNGLDRVVLLQKRLEAIGEIDKDDLKAEDITWLEDQILRTRALLEYFGLVDSIDTYLARAEKLLGQGRPELGAVNIVVQAANQSLSQALGLEMSTLPESAPDTLHAFAKRIERIEARFNRIKSEPCYAEIKRYIAEADAVSVCSPYQEKIETLDKSLFAISQRLAYVYDGSMRDAVEASLKTISEKQGKCRQAQYKAYQAWTIERCCKGMAKYKVWTRVDQVDAISVIDDYLIDIDSTLLTPDVSRLYHDVLGKQLAEINSKMVDVEVGLAKAEKKTLADF